MRKTILIFNVFILCISLNIPVFSRNSTQTVTDIQSDEKYQHVISAAREEEINNLIDKLVSTDRQIVEETVTKLKSIGDDALEMLRKSAKTKDRSLRPKIINAYMRILLEQKRDMGKDKLIIDSINDEYYMTRITVWSILAYGGYKNLVGKIVKKISEPAADDERIFNEIIGVIRERLDVQWQIISPYFLEDAYLVAMGTKINSKLENIISDENENVKLRKMLIKVYRDINKGEGNKYFLKVLEQTQNWEVKDEALIWLNSSWNENNQSLIEELKRISLKKNAGSKEAYSRVINDLIKKKQKSN